MASTAKWHAGKIGLSVTRIDRSLAIPRRLQHDHTNPELALVLHSVQHPKPGLPLAKHVEITGEYLTEKPANAETRKITGAASRRTR